MTESWPIENVHVASGAELSTCPRCEPPTCRLAALNSRGKNVVVTDRHTMQQNETRTREASDVIDIFAEKPLEIWPWF